jgi:hypothetical protein
LASHVRLTSTVSQDEHCDGPGARHVATAGADVLVDVRGNRVRAKQVPIPFKRLKKYGKSA